MQMYTDGSINYIKSSTDGSGAFPIQIHSGNSEVINIDDRNTQIKTGLNDKDGDLGTAGQVLSSTGTQVDWIDAPSGGLTIANNSNNRIVTGMGGSGLHAEGNLTFNSDTSTLTVTGDATISGNLTVNGTQTIINTCLLYTSPSPRD